MDVDKYVESSSNNVTEKRTLKSDSDTMSRPTKMNLKVLF